MAPRESWTPRTRTEPRRESRRPPMPCVADRHSRANEGPSRCSTSPDSRSQHLLSSATLRENVRRARHHSSCVSSCYRDCLPLPNTIGPAQSRCRDRGEPRLRQRRFRRRADRNAALLLHVGLAGLGGGAIRVAVRHLKRDERYGRKQFAEPRSSCYPSESSRLERVCPVPLRAPSGGQEVRPMWYETHSCDERMFAGFGASSETTQRIGGRDRDQ